MSAQQGEGNAGLVTRLLAAAVDAIAVVIATAGLYLGATGISFFWSPLRFQWPQPGPWISTLTLMSVAAAYLTVAWATTGRSYGATLLGCVSSRGVAGGWAGSGRCCGRSPASSFRSDSSGPPSARHVVHGTTSSSGRWSSTTGTATAVNTP